MPFFILIEKKWRKNNDSLKTYALMVISNNIAAIGIIIKPSQKTGDVNNCVCIPVNTAAIGIDGQKLLKKTNWRPLTDNCLYN